MSAVPHERARQDAQDKTRRIAGQQNIGDERASPEGRGK
jgi:hypothetical protein